MASIPQYSLVPSPFEKARESPLLFSVVESLKVIANPSVFKHFEASTRAAPERFPLEVLVPASWQHSNECGGRRGEGRDPDPEEFLG